MPITQQNQTPGIGTLITANPNRVIDDIQGQGKASFRPGAWFPGSSRVPRANWDRDDSQARLGRLDATFSFSNSASRSVVRI